jgi:hypothetical protein
MFKGYMPLAFFNKFLEGYYEVTEALFSTAETA